MFFSLRPNLIQSKANQNLRKAEAKEWKKTIISKFCI